MGIPISGPTYFYGDSMLAMKMKCNMIAYHALRESLTGHIRSEDNLDDLLAKVVTG